MLRVSAPLVLLPVWLVTVACSPHALRIGKCCSAGTPGLLARVALPLSTPGVHRGPSTMSPQVWLGLGGGGGAADRCPL